MKPGRLRWLMNVWPPFLAAGIRVREIGDDYRYVRVELRMGLLNRNYVGVHFGGSLFAMTDPFYMLMYLHNLGKGYLVWDQAASIRFLKPGRRLVRAEFRLDDQALEAARAASENGRRHLVDHVVEVKDQAGEVVARVERTVYIRKKKNN